MRRLEITAVMTSRDERERRHIEALAGPTPDGTHWIVSHKDAMEGLKRGRWMFCVRDSSGSLHEVQIAEKDGESYLRSAMDTQCPESLFSLPRAGITNYVFLRANEVVASKY